MGNAVFLRKCATVSEPILTKRPQKKHLNALLLFFAGISSELTYHQQVNPHRAGGRLDPPPIRYFVNNEKTAASSQKRRFWHTFLCILSAPFLKISAESHRRSDHQVRSSDPTSKNICDFTVTTVLKGSTWNLQGVIRVSVPTKRMSRNFYFGDLRSGQFCDLHIIGNGRKSRTLLCASGPVIFIMNWVMLGYYWWSRCKFWSVTFIEVLWGHMTSSEVTNRFWLITHDWKELETWAWSHCVCIVATHRLICSMTYLGQHLISGGLGLRSNIDLTFLMSPCKWFDVPWREEHAGTWIRPLAFLVRNLFAKAMLAKFALGVLWSLAHKPLMLSQIWRHVGERTGQGYWMFFPGPSN